MIRERRGKFFVKLLSEGRESAVTVFTDSIDRFCDGDFTFVRVTLQNDMPGVDLFRELSPGQRVSIRLEDHESRTCFSFETAMVASRSVAYWVDNAETIQETLDLAEDYHGPFGVSFIVAL